MGNVKSYKSIIKKEIKEQIKGAYWCSDLIQYATYKCEVDGLIAAGFLLCPEITIIKDYVFINYFMSCDEGQEVEYISSLEAQYGKDKKNIEMSVNTWSIGDLFLGDCTEKMDDEQILNQFGEMVCYFWQMRVDALFPQKNIVVEMGMNLMGEYGPCITMYER